MDDVWELIGLKSSADLAIKTLQEKDGSPVIIHGPACCGQIDFAEYLSRKIGDNVSKLTHFYGNSFSADVPLHPFSTGTFSFSKLSQKARDGLVATGRPLDVALGTPGLLTGGLHALNGLWEASKSNREKLNTFFDEAEIDVVLSHFPRNRNATKRILCFHNLEYLDEQTLHFLKRILNPKIREKIPRLRNCCILFCTEDATIAAKFVQKFDALSVAIQRCPKEKFGALLISLGAPGLPQQAIDRLWLASDGLFEVVKYALQCLRSEDEAADIDNVRWRNTLTETVRHRIEEYEMKGLGIKDAISIAIGIGPSGLRMELQCILDKSTSKRSVELIPALESLNFVDLDKGRFLVRREWLEDFPNIRNRVSRERVAKLHEDCIRQIDPGQYYRRSALSADAEQIEQSLVLEIVGRNREQLSGTEQTRPLSEHLSSHCLRSVANAFSNGLSEYLKSNFETACTIFETLPDTLPLLLRAERDFFLATARMSTHQEGGAQAALQLLDRWKDALEGEAEIKLRIMSRRIDILAFCHRHDDAKLAEIELVEYIEQNWSFNSRFMDFLHATYRRSYMTHTVEASSFFIKQAVDYFDSRGENVVVLIERFKSLNNYCGNLIQNARYEEAARFAVRATKLMSAHDDVVFPRKDLVWNNLILSLFRSGQIEAKEAISFQQNVITDLCYRTDVPSHISNLGIYLCHDGQVSAALDLFLDLKERIQAGEIGESFLTYPIYCNLTACMMVSGDREAALRNEEKLKCFTAINWHLTPYTRRRAALIERAIATGPTNDAAAWETIMLGLDPKGPGQPWQHYGRGFFGSQLSFITDL
ncbi:hypothetical protein [uncultured Cohaesibacter sp.]|uniref:hypothetical protein n=1 Tax=uncultured Cohaesibacter sp. TaxID=1002546 RepID=UPI0029C720CA|nr:hypothetical protein [uncultured Cohaesibacter sp.]